MNHNCTKLAAAQPAVQIAGTLQGEEAAAVLKQVVEKRCVAGGRERLMSRLRSKIFCYYIYSLLRNIYAV